MSDDRDFKIDYDQRKAETDRTVTTPQIQPHVSDYMSANNELNVEAYAKDLAEYIKNTGNKPYDPKLQGIWINTEKPVSGILSAILRYFSDEQVEFLKNDILARYPDKVDLSTNGKKRAYARNTLLNAWNLYPHLQKINIPNEFIEKVVYPAMVHHAEIKHTGNEFKKLVGDDSIHVLLAAANMMWNHRCVELVENKSLGDIERKNYEYEKEKLKKIIFNLSNIF